MISDLNLVIEILWNIYFDFFDVFVNTFEKIAHSVTHLGLPAQLIVRVEPNLSSNAHSLTNCTYLYCIPNYTAQQEFQIISFSIRLVVSLQLQYRVPIF